MKKTMLMLLLMFVIVGCENDPKENTPEPTTLLNTKWKLVGFFDIEKNELTEAKPKDREESYLLNFITDSTVSGYTYLNEVLGKYSINYSSNELAFTKFIPISYAEEVFDSSRYTEAVLLSSSFEYFGDTLRLYYDDKTMYLLFTEVK